MKLLRATGGVFFMFYIYRMKTCISMLRGINVSGQKKIRMADLKKLYEELKLKEVITYIQSGNVIFKTAEKNTDEKIAALIEKAIQKKYGFEVPVIVRSAAEMNDAIKNNPFIKNKNEPERIYISFLSEIPSEDLVAAIQKTDFSPERFMISGKEIYLHVPNGYGNSKLSNNFFEKKLNVKATTRNWNTVNKLAELAASL